MFGGENFFFVIFRGKNFKSVRFLQKHLVIHQLKWKGLSKKLCIIIGTFDYMYVCPFEAFATFKRPLKWQNASN